MSYELVELGKICKFIRGPFGGSLKKNIFVNDGYAVYEQQHAIYNQFNEIRYFIDENKFKEMSRFELFPNDLIMSCSGTMGKVAVVPKEIKRGIINQALLKLTPSNDIDRVYLKWLMTSSYFQEKLSELSGGAAIQNVASVKLLKEIKIPLPPLFTQQKIVAKLDAIFAEIDKASAAAEASAKNTEALFQSFLTEIIEKDSSDCESVKIGDICEIARGGSPRPIDKFITEAEDGINWIKISDATRSKKYIYETRERIIKDGVSSSRLVNDGDFLLSNSMSFGRPYIMRTSGCIHDGWLVLTNYQKYLDINFFYYLLSSPIVVRQFENLAQGSTVRNLNKELVSRVKIKLPTLTKQKDIVLKLDALVAKLDIVKNSYSLKLKELAKLRNSILKEAFNGDLIKV